MSSPTAIMAAYAATSFEAATPAGLLRLRIGESSDALARLYRDTHTDRAAFLTAFNPGSIRQTDDWNAAAQSKLIHELTARGFVWFKGVGRDPSDQWPAEMSALVLGISAKDACALGDQFGQAAIVWAGADATPQLVPLVSINTAARQTRSGPSLDITSLLRSAWDHRIESPAEHAFRLASGRGVLIEAFHFEETYAGFLGGIVDEDENARLTERSRRRMDPIWGKGRPLYLIPSVGRVFYEPSLKRCEVRLPRFRYHVWLISPPFVEHHAGSELIVCWHGPRDPNRSICDLVAHACGDIPWEDVAHDYDN